MASVKEESEDIKIEDAISVKQEDTEEQTANLLREVRSLSTRLLTVTYTLQQTCLLFPCCVPVSIGNKDDSLMGRTHAKAALGGSDCPHFGDMSLRNLKLCVPIIQGDELTQQALTRSSSAASSSKGGQWCELLMRICQGQQLEHDLHYSDIELLSVLSKAVDELGLERAPPAELARSCLDEWYLQSDRGRTVDGTNQVGHVKLAPVEEDVAVHLCPSTAANWRVNNAPLSSEPCRATANFPGKAFSVAGQAA
ncbi:hypothetical protein cypCar_00043953 [Cyprinus carpio]|nr:hypothetical protein cypCar_00043953 [Cyprinus carpio]